jgi:hypothetical protein
MLVVFFLFSLRVINWFQYPYILASGDLRPPLVSGAFLKNVQYTWNEIDFGLPSVYPPRILDPFYFFITILQSLGIGLYLSEAVTAFLLFFLSSILMYVFVKQLTNGDIVASLVASLYLTSNLYLINDREVTALGFMDISLIILPCLITFTKSLKTQSYKVAAISGLLCTLTYATFPNYRNTLICLIMLGVLFVFYFASNGLHVSLYGEKESKKTFGIHVDVTLLGRYFKLLAVFVVMLLLASIWVGAIVFSNFNVFSASYSQISTPSFVSGLNVYDITRLVTKWGFYSGALGRPYLPYAHVYLSDPSIIILCYLPAILAFASLLLSRKREITLFFGCVAILGIFLASGFSFNEYLNNFYSAFTGLPFLNAFREPSNWVFFIIISFSILIGLTSSALFHRFKKNVLKIFIISLVVLLFIATAYPLTTGEVTENWLNPSIKGTSLPTSYVQLNNMLSNQYWALLLPQRGTYVAYNFSGIPFNTGNPYPLIFSKPIISGLGTEYLQSENSGLLNRVYSLMQTNQYENVAPKGNASASSVEREGETPALAIDGNYSTRWASKTGMPQWFEIDWNSTQELSEVRIVFQNAYANDYTIETCNGSNWTTQITVENNTLLEPEYVFPQLTTTTKLRINFTEASPFNMVSIWELEVYGQTDGPSKFLGMLGIEYLVVEKDFISGNAYNVSELELNQDENFILTKEWDEVTLYNNTHALQKLYTADNILNYTTLDDMYQTVDESGWGTLQRSVLLNSTSNTIENGALVPPENFMWTELSPTSYVAHVESKGAFFLVFLESYDKNWKVSVNGNPVSETNHQEVNAFANGWLINSTGNLTISIQYETQNVFLVSVVASLILPALLIAFLSRKDIKRVGNLIRHKFKPAKVKSEQEMQNASRQAPRLNEKVA